MHERLLLHIALISQKGKESENPCVNLEFRLHFRLRNDCL